MRKRIPYTNKEEVNNNRYEEVEEGVQENFAINLFGEENKIDMEKRKREEEEYRSKLLKKSKKQGSNKLCMEIVETNTELSSLTNETKVSNS